MGGGINSGGSIGFTTGKLASIYTHDLYTVVATHFQVDQRTLHAGTSFDHDLFADVYDREEIRIAAEDKLQVLFDRSFDTIKTLGELEDRIEYGRPMTYDSNLELLRSLTL